MPSPVKFSLFSLLAVFELVCLYANADTNTELTKLDKWLRKNVQSDDPEANYMEAMKFRNSQAEKKSLFRDRKLYAPINHWRSLYKAKHRQECNISTMEALNYVSNDLVAKQERLSRVLKPLAMESATVCAYANQEKLIEASLHEVKDEHRKNVFNLIDDEFIEKHKQLNAEICLDKAETQMIKSNCNSPYANLDQLARQIMHKLPLPSKITHNSQLPANMEFSSFAQVLKKYLIDSCDEFVDKTWHYFVGLATLTGYWDEGYFYEKQVRSQHKLMQNLFRFNMCRQIRADRQLDLVLLTIIAKLRGEI